MFPISSKAENHHTAQPSTYDASNNVHRWCETALKLKMLQNDDTIDRNELENFSLSVGTHSLCSSTAVSLAFDDSKSLIEFQFHSQSLAREWWFRFPNGHCCKMLHFMSCLQTPVYVYYESLCPDSQAFITKQLYPSMKILKDHVDLHLIPFGKSTVSVMTHVALETFLF